MSAPLIETITLGPFATNCYIVAADASDAAHEHAATSGAASGGGVRGCWIIDASFGPGALIDRVHELGLRPEALILTHAHADHIAGVDEVCEAFPGLIVWLHESEREFTGSPALNLSAGFPPYVTCRAADRLLRGGEVLKLDDTRWRVLHTPGHSPGGITLVNDEHRVAIVGDTLFAGSVGRFDFPTSDEKALVRSIKELLYALPEDTTVYPGHGPPTTIGREKRSNPFVRA